MSVQVIKSFVGRVGRTFEVEVEVGGQGVGGQESAGRSAVLWVQAQVAAKDTSDFSLAVMGAGLSWLPVAGETLAENNRRYRGGIWMAKAVPAGLARITITCGRAASVMGFVALVAADEPPDVPEPVEERREVSVVVRELAAGETHEVRYVRPGELVMKDGGGGIDWEKTPFVAHGFVIEA